MADEADIANDYAERWLKDALAANCPEIPEGSPGECDWCGEDSLRLVNGYCARCRDENKLG